MADTEINVVKRPAEMSVLDVTFHGWPVFAGLVAAGLWLVHLDGRTDTNGTNIVTLRAGLQERDARWEAATKAQSERVDWITGDRVTDLQRLAMVEEAVKGAGRHPARHPSEARPSAVGAGPIVAIRSGAESGMERPDARSSLCEQRRLAEGVSVILTA